MKTEILNAPSFGQSARSLDNLPFVLSLATEADREEIYRLRHEVYARELAQHAATPAGSLRDALDDWNSYLIVKIAGQIAGFISITPPCAGKPIPESYYSIDKYVQRDALPFPFDDRLYEVRLLTVLRPHRGRALATLLLCPAFRCVEA